MTAFAYAGSPDPIRADLAEAHRAAWRHLAAPGTWLGAAERVAVAAETRRARDCRLCAKRKAALSPYADPDMHAAAAPLSAALVDAIHRVATDASRLTRAWFESLASAGISEERYAEALGVAVLTISVDAFQRALGLPLEPLPAPERGEPKRVRPRGLERGDAWLPMIDPRRADAAERDLFGRGPLGAAFVIRALSLVPNVVRAWSALSAAQYLSFAGMTRLETGRALDRAQMELVAGRVSALNACFY
jgi:hypothetical protein